MGEPATVASDDELPESDVLDRPATAPVFERRRSQSVDEKKEEKTKGQNVSVICRFRPENELELSKGGKTCVEFPKSSDQKVTLNIVETKKSHTFRFDRVLQVNCCTQASH